MSLISEKEIIEKVLGGDVNAFEELVLSYEKTVYNLALRMVSDRDDAFDMTQEAALTKLMWILGQTENPSEVRKMFYETVNYDILITEK